MKKKKNWLRVPSCHVFFFHKFISGPCTEATHACALIPGFVFWALEKNCTRQFRALHPKAVTLFSKKPKRAKTGRKVRFFGVVSQRRRAKNGLDLGNGNFRKKSGKSGRYREVKIVAAASGPGGENGLLTLNIPILLLFFTNTFPRALLAKTGKTQPQT